MAGAHNADTFIREILWLAWRNRSLHNEN